MVQRSFPFLGNDPHRNGVDQCLIAVNHKWSERLKSAPQVPVANGPMHIVKAESVRNEHC
jgi:hypothetical protein